MTRSEKNRLTIAILGAAMVSAGYMVMKSGNTGLGAVLSFTGSLTMAVGAIWLALDGRGHRQ